MRRKTTRSISMSPITQYVLTVKHAKQQKQVKRIQLRENSSQFKEIESDWVIKIPLQSDGKNSRLTPIEKPNPKRHKISLQDIWIMKLPKESSRWHPKTIWPVKVVLETNAIIRMRKWSLSSISKTMKRRSFPSLSWEKGTLS